MAPARLASASFGGASLSLCVLLFFCLCRCCPEKAAKDGGRWSEREWPMVTLYVFLYRYNLILVFVVACAGRVPFVHLRAGQERGAEQKYVVGPGSRRQARLQCTWVARLRRTCRATRLFILFVLLLMRGESPLCISVNEGQDKNAEQQYVEGPGPRRHAGRCSFRLYRAKLQKTCGARLQRHAGRGSRRHAGRGSFLYLWGEAPEDMRGEAPVYMRGEAPEDMQSKALMA